MTTACPKSNPTDQKKKYHKNKARVICSDVKLDSLPFLPAIHAHRDVVQSKDISASGVICLNWVSSFGYCKTLLFGHPFILDNLGNQISIPNLRDPNIFYYC